MDKDKRNAIERATQRARKLLEEDFTSQLEGTFDVLRSGAVASKAGPHLTPRQVFQRDKIVATIEHKRSIGMSSVEAVVGYLRDAAFTTLNRFVALKMLEARELVQECITKGEQSAGYREFCGLAPGLALLPDSAGYRLYLESLCDELSTEIKVLFDRRDPASVLWPKRATFEGLLEVLNTPDLAKVWADDETIGWVYQFFNSGEERKRMRDESQAPRNSRELAVRNQFFTPRYVVEFLVDNTLGRTWLQMHGEGSVLAERCRYFVRSEEEAARARLRKDPRDLRVLDPACGSGHFLLYCFDLLLVIYEEAWAAEASGARRHETGRTLREDYPDLGNLRLAMPALILEHSLHGVDIDPRAAQIASLALWLRAQRAWKDFRVPASERPPIRRTHVVAAEPMPGDAALVEEFAERLYPPLLRDLFQKMVSEMRLAGELGTLIPVEEGIAAELSRAREQFVKQRQSPGFLPGMEPVRRQGELDFSGIDDDRFFHEAEARIVESLRHFAEAAANGASVRRRLFAGDAAQGIALIDLLRTRFDVVLMNPPFGAASLAAKKEFERAYPRTKNDVYAAFVERGMQLLGSRGLLGAITSGTYFNLSTFSNLRAMLLSDWSARVFVDLGSGVMDDAAVTAACTVVEHTPSAEHEMVTFIDLRFAADRAVLLEACTGPSAADSSPRTQVGIEVLLRFPDKIFAYWLTDGLRKVFAQLPALGQRADATFGLHCRGGDERFYRAWWEVSPYELDESAWPCVFLGDTPQHMYRDSYYVVDWRQNARALREVASRASGGTFTGKEHYFHPGLTYIYTAQTTFSVQPLPRGSIFTAAAHGLFPGKDENHWAWLAWLNSEPVRLLTKVINPNRFFQASYVRMVPVPDFQPMVEELALLAREAVALSLLHVSSDERSRHYCIDWASACSLGNGESPFVAAVSVACKVAARLAEIRQRINEMIVEAYQLTNEDLRVLMERIGPSTARPLPGSVDVLAEGPSATAKEHLSALVGIAFGRWDESKCARSLQSFAAQDPFARLGTPPALLFRGAPPRILVDDPGHPDDIETCVLEVAHKRWGGSFESTLSDLLSCLGERNALRQWLARNFFAYHLSRYSFSQSHSPIYWQLATSSAGYSVWVYLHAFSRDTLYKAQNDYVAPKLAQEERRLESLQHELGESPKATERKNLASQEAFVSELRAFVDELKRVTPLWSPKLDDGVIINFAPLWRLVPHHKAWQKELKATWDALCAETYDWAHLAMHLWPERVVPKCATDRSLAIAHGLEDVFWVEGPDGKWKARLTPLKSVEELVRERSSPAVKAALASLLDAPTAAGTGRNRRRGAAASAGPEEGSR